MLQIKKHKQGGFTIVEVLIAASILGIIAAIAVPSYTSHTRKVRRADAKVTLTNSAQQLERCNIELDAYNDTDCSSTLASGGSVTTPEGFYTVTASTLTATTFTLTATPVAGHGQDNDGDCTTFTLNQAGAQGATGANASTCW